MNYFSKCVKFIGQSVFGPKFKKEKKNEYDICTVIAISKSMYEPTF